MMENALEKLVFEYKNILEEVLKNLKKGYDVNNLMDKADVCIKDIDEIIGENDSLKDEAKGYFEKYKIFFINKEIAEELIIQKGVILDGLSALKKNKKALYRYNDMEVENVVFDIEV